jgi:hypothetical protein
MEDVHRPQGTNLIATLSGHKDSNAELIAKVNLTQAYTFALNQALRANIANGNTPLLWVYTEDTDSRVFEIKFGFDTLVQQGGGQVRIGHVALMDRAIIAGEIYPDGGRWEIDNNSGAWGSMSNQNGKTTMMGEIASYMSRERSMKDLVSAWGTYSRNDLLRTIQQGIPGYPRLMRARKRAAQSVLGVLAAQADVVAIR